MTFSFFHSRKHVVTSLADLLAARGRVSVSAQPGSTAGASLAPLLCLELSQSLHSERAGVRWAGPRARPRGPLGGAAAAAAAVRASRRRAGAGRWGSGEHAGPAGSSLPRGAARGPGDGSCLSLTSELPER